MRVRAIVRATAVSLLVAASARAETFPARSGETGILDVPDAEVAGEGNGKFAAEYRFDRASGRPADFGPLPVYAVAGLTGALDVGLSIREWGQPGDPRPGRTLFGAAAKLQLLPPEGPMPGFAVSATVDRVNDRGTLGARLAASTSPLPIRFAAFVGAEAEMQDVGGAGLSAGLAGALPLTPATSLVAEALTGPRGANFGAAVRWAAHRVAGVSLGANYFPGDEAFRVAVTFAFAPAAKPKHEVQVVPALPAPREEEPVPTGPRFTDDRPRMRLRLPLSSPERLALARHLQYAPYSGPAVGATGPARAPAAQVRPAAASLEDLAEAQLKEQTALADARARRVRATAEQLEERAKAAAEEAKRLAERERELAGREQQLQSREKRVLVRGAPTQQQRQLESLEAQLVAKERQLTALERGYGPPLDAAQGRERDAQAREDAERQEASRLNASAASATTRAQQLEIRKQALGATLRQLTAFETRLVAKGERIDALERQLRATAERLDTWSRRLDVHGERLDLLERRASDQQKPAEPKTAQQPTPAPKDKAAFVMVVKSPTAIVKERGPAPAAAASDTALHPGVAVEKAVAAAAVVMFPTPQTQLTELDREAIDKIAKLAARENCELLIWARAKDPGLLAEAQRRAGEVRTRVVASGPLDSNRVVTRITTRPGAQGVDVVVSALRETAKPAQAPTPSATAAPMLLEGESGKRQIREAIVAVQPRIEACASEHIERTKLARAEGLLKLTVSAQGRVVSVTTGDGDLSGTNLQECLTRTLGAWTFPASDGGFAVDVPITVIRKGGAP